MTRTTSIPCDRCRAGEPCGSCLNQGHVAVDPLTDNEAFIYLCAVRYALNRQTYAGSIVIDELMRVIPRLSYNDRKTFERDIADALFRNEVDVPHRVQWEGVVDTLRHMEGS